ncbi:MAG TPA: AAA family ATPase [Roseiflexaceae bacterium]
MVRSWLLPAVYERHLAGLGAFLTELRPAVSLFLSFTGIAYDADPDAGAKLDRFIRWTQRTIAPYDGTLLQLTIGDKGSYLYVAFGAPVAHEDAAQRAALAALALQKLPPELGFLRTIQIGVSQGTMRTGAYGGATRQTYGVLGEEVNLAARLMSLAAPGEVLVSGQLHTALGPMFTLEPLPPVALKGIAAPAPAFRLLGARERSIHLAEPAYALPMIGRAAELALITEKLELALGGQGQVVGITAEAGMGKSRLLAEVIRSAQRRGMRGFGGACQSYGANSSYLAWGPIWRAVFDLDAAASLDLQAAILEGEIEALAPERRSALPLLGPLLDLDLPENDFTRGLDPQYRQSALHALLLDCLRAMARAAAAESRGLLFVLEDMHWLDPASHDLLDLVAGEIAAPVPGAGQGLPVLIVLAYRPPELMRLQTPRVERVPHFTHVGLAALTDDEARQLVDVKLIQWGIDPFEGDQAAIQQLTSTIVARAQGNPFYVEELLNYLRDRGVDPRDTAALAALELPSSLHSLILSRIDQLSERERATLKVASVIGRLFRFAWLHGAYSLLGAPEALKADLDELARLDLTPLDTPEPELTYLFKHIVTQEVAYESLTAQARTALHEHLAIYLEGLDAERHLDLLAYHYDRTANLSKRREYLRRAGEAAARFANVEALDYLSRALDLTPEADATERYALLLAREQVEDLQGMRAAQGQDLAALEALAESFDDDRRRAEIAALQARYAFSASDYPTRRMFLEDVPYHRELVAAWTESRGAAR